MVDLASRKYLRYDSEVTKVPASEAADIEILKKAFAALVDGDFATYRHAFPASHARTLGIIKGKMTVSESLPPHLKQSFLANAGEYPVVLRFSTQNHLVSSPDFETQFRAASLKIFNVTGDRLPDGTDYHTQDLTFNSHICEHDLSDAVTAREIILLRLKGVADPDGMNKAINARSDAHLQNARLSAPMRPVQCMPMYSQVPYRYGDYVVKMALIPTSATQKQWEEKTVPKDCKDPNIVTKWLTEYFTQNEAEYEMKVQFCENVEEQNVEFAGTSWEPTKYPYQTIAKIVFPKQNSMDYDLKAFWEDHLAMYSWKGLETLEPLGGANRVRRVMYPLVRGLRAKYNSRAVVNPRKITDLPGVLPAGVPT